MEFTKENWENAPEGARLAWRSTAFWEPVDFVGWLKDGRAAIETYSYGLMDTRVEHLRIVLPARKVTVQLYRTNTGQLVTVIVNAGFDPYDWTLVGEHTFEIEGE